MPRTHRDAQLEQFWRRHVEQHRQCGSTARAYCRRHGLAEPSFYSWRRILRQRDAEPAGSAARTVPSATPTPAFLPVTVVDLPHPPAEVPIDIRLAGGRRVRVRSGCDRTLLADVLALLQAPLGREGRPC